MNFDFKGLSKFYVTIVLHN